MPALTSDRRTTLPGPFDRIGYVVTVRRSEAQTDAEVGELRMRVMATMKFGDRLGITFSGFRFNQNTLLEMRFK